MGLIKILGKILSTIALIAFILVLLPFGFLSAILLGIYFGYLEVANYIRRSIHRDITFKFKSHSKDYVVFQFRCNWKTAS